MRLASAALLLLLSALAGDARADAERDRWVEWHRRRAMNLDAEGRALEATEEWVAVARLLPDDPRAATRAAVSMIELIAEPPNQPKPTDREYQAAEALIRSAIRNGALHDPALAYAIGRLRFADGKYDTAERMLGTAVRRGYDPVRALLWHGRAVISDSARVMTESAQGTDIAVERLRRLIEGQPNHPDLLAARINLATAYKTRGEHVLAEQSLLEVLRTADWAARAHLALAEVYAEQDRRDEARAAYRRARDTAAARDDGIYTGRDVLIAVLRSESFALLGQNDLDAAERSAKQYLELERDSGDAYYVLGMVELRRGQPDKAVPLLRRAKRLQGTRTQLLSALIQALTLTNQKDEAEQVQAELDDLRRREEEERRKKAFGGGK